MTQENVKIIALVLLCCWSFVVHASDNRDPISATIGPGESVVCHGIELTFRFEPGGQIEKHTPSRFVDMKGPQTSLLNRFLTQAEVPAYLDGVYCQLKQTSHGRHGPRRFQLSVVAVPQSDEITLSAAPAGMNLYVSHVNPILIDGWNVSIGKEPVRGTEGDENFELLFENKETEEVITILALENMLRQVGRFSIRVEEFYEPTLTARLGVDVSEDKNAVGGDAYTKSFPDQAVLEQDGMLMLEAIGREYGFEVEWLGEQHFVPPISIPRRPGIVSTLVERNFRPYLDFEWVSPTHVKVRASETALALAREQKHTQQRGEERVRLFNEKYPLMTKVYSLQNIGSEAAKSVIDPLLGTVSLLLCEGTMGLDSARAVLAREYSATTLESAEDFWVTWSPGKIVDSEKSVEERSIADPSQEIVVVMATPPTLEKVDEMLAKMDQVLKVETSEQPSERYRIEAILLQGGKMGQAREGSKVEAASSVLEASRRDLEVASMENQQMAELYQARQIPRSVLLKSEAALLSASADYAAAFQNYNHLDQRSLVFDPNLAEKVGISSEDLEFMGFDAVAELAKGVLFLAAERGQAGMVTVALRDDYACRLEFLDYREPYVVVKGALLGGPATRVLMENTLYLETNTPTLVGLTNLREALILVLTLR